MASFSWPPESGGAGSSVPTYTDLASFPSAAGEGNGALGIALDTNILYESNGATWIAIGGPGAVLSVGAFGSTPNTAGLSISSNVLTMQPADATRPGGVSIAAQTIAGAKTFSSSPLIPDGTQALPGIAFSSETSSGLYRLGTADIGLSVSNILAVEAIKVGTNVNLGFNIAASTSTAVPAIFASSLNGTQFFQYGNQNVGASSVTSFQILNGTFSANNATEIGNAAYLSAGYLSGGSWLSATAFQTQLNVMSESATGYIGFNVGGKTLATERMRLNTTNLTINSGLPIIMNGSSSGAISITTQAAAGTYNFNLPITAGTSGYGLTSAGGGSSAMTWTNFQAAGNYITALTGDVTASGPGSVAATLASVATAGTTGSSTAIPVITINVKGLTTSITTAAVVAPAGTLTGTVLASNVVTSSLTTVGTVGTGVWQGTAVAATYGGTGIDTHASTGYPSISSGTWSVASAATTFVTLYETVATTGGDILYGGASGTPTRLANGSANQFLQSAGGTSAPTWATAPGGTYWSGWYPCSGANYWSNTNTSYGDFTTNGTIPTPTALQNAGSWSVTKATSNLPGIGFTAPRTGAIEITFVVCFTPGLNAAATLWQMKLVETVGSLEIGSVTGTITANNASGQTESATIKGYLAVTASTAYNLKVQSAIASGTFFIGGQALTGASTLSISIHYIS